MIKFSKKTLTAMVIAMLSLSVISGCGKKDVNPETTNATTSNDDKAVQEEKVTPTFMYFVSENDADFEASQEVFKNLNK